MWSVANLLIRMSWLYLLELLTRAMWNARGWRETPRLVSFMFQNRNVYYKDKFENICHLICHY